jgi:hypothetical protein
MRLARFLGFYANPFFKIYRRFYHALKSYPKRLTRNRFTLRIQLDNVANH